MNLLSTKEVAEKLGLCTKTFLRKARKHKIGFYGSRNAMSWDEAEVLSKLRFSFDEIDLPDSPKLKSKPEIVSKNKYSEALGL